MIILDGSFWAVGSLIIVKHNNQCSKILSKIHNLAVVNGVCLEVNTFKV